MRISPTPSRWSCCSRARAARNGRSSALSRAPAMAGCPTDVARLADRYRKATEIGHPPHRGTLAPKSSGHREPTRAGGRRQARARTRGRVQGSLRGQARQAARAVDGSKAKLAKERDIQAKLRADAQAERKKRTDALDAERKARKTRSRRARAHSGQDEGPDRTDRNAQGEAGQGEG